MALNVRGNTKPNTRYLMQDSNEYGIHRPNMLCLVRYDMGAVMNCWLGIGEWAGSREWEREAMKSRRKQLYILLDACPTCLSFLAMGEEVYRNNTKSVCELPNLRTSFRECAETKEFQSQFVQYSENPSVLHSGHFRTCMRILTYTIQARYLCSSALVDHVWFIFALYTPLFPLPFSSPRWTLMYVRYQVI